MEDTETPRMRKYGESKTTQIMMATVPHVTSGSGQKISGRWIFVRQDCTCLTLSLCVTSGYVPQLQKKKIILLMKQSHASHNICKGYNGERQKE